MRNNRCEIQFQWNTFLIIVLHLCTIGGLLIFILSYFLLDPGVFLHLNVFR